MANLLSANLLRLKKSRLFWGTLAFCLGFGIFMVFNYYQMDQYDSITLNGAFFVYPIIVSIIMAVFIPLFFGREYSDGAIRNKVAAGYPRSAIYGADLLTGMAVSLLFCAAHMAVVAAAGTPLVGFIVMDAGRAVLMILGSLLAVAAFCAFFTIIVMICDRKSVSAVVCVLGVFLLLIASIYMKSRLDSPEYYTDHAVWENGMPIPGGLVKNPQYLGGTQRTVFELLYSLLPSSQVVQYSSQETQNLGSMPLYALAAIALSSGLGLLLFRRKDLK